MQPSRTNFRTQFIPASSLKGRDISLPVYCMHVWYKYVGSLHGNTSQIWHSLNTMRIDSMFCECIYSSVLQFHHGSVRQIGEETVCHSVGYTRHPTYTVGWWYKGMSTSYSAWEILTRPLRMIAVVLWVFPARVRWAGLGSCGGGVGWGSGRTTLHVTVHGTS